MPGQLLVASDLTDRSVPPLERALALAAAAPGRRLTALHVIDPDLEAGLRAERAREAADSLGGALRERALSDTPAPEVLVRAGDPAATILAVARELDADLVVMGAARPRGVVASITGTTVERTIRGAAAPVLLARLPGAAPWRRVTVATDLSEMSARALRVAAALGLLAGAQVELVHAFRPVVPRTAGFGGMRSSDLGRYAAAERAALRRELDAFLATAGAQPLHADPVLVEGAAAQAVSAHAAATGAGLIVAGTRGRSGLAGLLLGSTVRELLAAAPCDVLAVPPAPG